MLEPFVLIVTGPPCSGKSTLAAVLGAHFGVPLIEKDVIKETLFDTLDSAEGGRSREWSRTLSTASFATMLRLASRFVGQGGSIIVEGNFRPEHARDLEALRAAGATLMQVCCRGEGQALVERFEARARLQLRHPGHLDQETLAEMRASLLKGSAPPLAIGGARWDFDSTSAEPGQVDALVAAIAAEIAAENGGPGGLPVRSGR